MSIGCCIHALRCSCTINMTDLSSVEPAPSQAPSHSQSSLPDLPSLPPSRRPSITSIISIVDEESLPQLPCVSFRTFITVLVTTISILCFLSYSYYSQQWMIRAHHGRMNDMLLVDVRHAQY